MAWQPPNSGQDPNSAYGTPSNPYGAPQNPYGAPPENPYGAPQNPYATTPGYGDPNSQQSYAYAAPPSAPLPLGQALQSLPSQYIKVLTKPSAMTFAGEMGKAAWDIVWVQLLIYAIIGAVLGFLGSLISTSRLNTATTSGTSVNPVQIQAFTTGLSFSYIILIPLGFFISVGILYLIAKAFKGQGTFLQQSYTTLLFQVPLGIVSLLAGLIPIVGALIGFAASIYSIVLQVFAIMAVHRLSGGKATAVVLIPVAVALVLACAAFVAFIVIIAAAINGGR